MTSANCSVLPTELSEKRACDESSDTQSENSTKLEEWAGMPWHSFLYIFLECKLDSFGFNLRE